MKKTSVKTHLKDYSIYKNRWTTLNHAFAAALSAADVYDDQIVDNALAMIGQSTNADLVCVYCDELAQTWDHLSSTVSKGEFSGIGHQIGNLVPCCKTCNSRKGSKTWAAYIQSCNLDETTKQQKLAMLARYISQGVVNTKEIINKYCSREVTELNAIKSEIYQLMKKADEISTAVRRIVRENKN